MDLTNSHLNNFYTFAMLEPVYGFGEGESRLTSLEFSPTQDLGCVMPSLLSREMSHLIINDYVMEELTRTTIINDILSKHDSVVVWDGTNIQTDDTGITFITNRLNFYDYLLILNIDNPLIDKINLQLSEDLIQEKYFANLVIDEEFFKVFRIYTKMKI